MKRILIAASFEKGRGTGHLLRSARLAADLRERGFCVDLCITDCGRIEEARALLGLPLAQYLKPSPDPPYDLVITDRFQTPPGELSAYMSFEGEPPVLGIDEGGAARCHFDFLLDILHIADEPPNERVPSFAVPPGIPCKDASLVEPRETQNIKTLIVFGGEDAAGLGRKVYNSLSRKKGFTLTLVSPENRIPNLREKICEFDLVITHYGLTAFEALTASVPVALVHPTRLHRLLAKRAGLPTLPAPHSKVLDNARLWVTDTIAPQCQKAAEGLGLGGKNADRRSLADYIAAFGLKSASPAGKRACPLCGAHGEIIARFPERTYRKCRSCGMVYMARLTPPPVEYAEDYFFDFYKKQYGKTYIEDFENLKNFASRRLNVIQNLLQPYKKRNPQTAAPPPVPKILELGCAYGPFLQAAYEAGFDAAGQDPAESAVLYVNEVLHLRAYKGFFPDGVPISANGGALWKDGGFDAVAAWYVIEHFPTPRRAIEKAASLLKKGGVFAFSTPSGGGVSALKSRKNFLGKSPADHWTIWNPRLVKKQMALFGLCVKKIIITGLHPERFPKPLRFLPPPFLVFLSKLFLLGDTFEVYAVKK